jgi:glycogen debranching enzyme
VSHVSLPSARDVEQLVRARGVTFLVTDRNGDVAPAGARELGLFDHDTRYLSYYALSFGAAQVVRLSADTRHDAYNQIDLMLTDLERGDVLDDPKNFLHIRRRQVLDGGLAEEIVFTNFLRRRVLLECTLRYDADFVDIFEVRGAVRKRRGKKAAATVKTHEVVMAYEGLDASRYSTRLTFSPAPAEVDANHAHFRLDIPPGETMTLEVAVVVARESAKDDAPAATENPLIERRSRMFDDRVQRLEREKAEFCDASTRFVCSDMRIQQVLDQGIDDLHDLCVRLGPNAIVGAGIPWFCAPFGRDSLLTSYEALLVNPALAEGSLRALAAWQGKVFDDRTEEEPGKIFHEFRFGEMVRTKEIPHSPYYGSIDATPLFVILLDATYRVTGDRAFLRELRAPLLAALAWIDTRSANGTRFVTYAKKTDRGLDNQGWKDSRAGVSFPDGRHAEPPIGLCEVQGYCADAYRRSARVLDALDEHELARTYQARGRTMAELIERELWLPDYGRYAFAVDGGGRPLPTVVSNLGHLLWTRIPSKERAQATARTLLAPQSFAGYGVRTLASDQGVYNPLSYHNGTVWPHDNALIARGFANYGLRDEAERIFDGMYEAMGYFADRRLPELFCGVSRRAGPLVRYPVACSPQAWAAAAPFLLLQSLLGLHVDAEGARLAIRNPRLPRYITRLELRSLRIGPARVTISFVGAGDRCQIDRLDVTGGPLKTEVEID